MPDDRITIKNNWARLESSAREYMESTHKRLLDMVDNDPEFKPKVYMHPLLKEGLFFESTITLNGKVIEVLTDSNMIMGEIYIMDKSYI